VVALCVAIAAGAAEPVSPPASPTGPLTSIADLVRAAAQNDAGLRASRLRARAALAAGERATRWDDPVIGLEGGRVDRADADDVWHGRIAVMQRIPLGGEAAARGANADSLRVLAEAAGTTGRVTLMMEVRHLVVALRLALAQESTARTAMSDATSALAQVSNRLAAGNARQADLLGAQLDRDEAQAAVTLAGHQVTAARAALARRCGVGPGQISDPPALALAERAHDIVLATSAKHPRLLQADAQVRVAESQAALARSGRWGDVRAGAFGDREGDDNEIGLLLEIPLPAWNRNEAAVTAALAEAEATRAERDQLARQVAAEAEAAWFAWDTAQQRAAHHRQHLLPRAGEALTLALADYAAGRGDLAMVLTALHARTRLAGETAEAEAERDHALVTVHAIAPVIEDLP
jgi:outer membrane protein TolC